MVPAWKRLQPWQGQAAEAQARAQPQKQLFAALSSCRPQILSIGMAGAPGDVPRCQRAGEHHRPAEQVSSPVAAGWEQVFPPRSIFPLRKEARVIPEKPENSRAFAKWKKCLLPRSEFLPLSLG